MAVLTKQKWGLWFVVLFFIFRSAVCGAGERETTQAEYLEETRSVILLELEKLFPGLDIDLWIKVRSADQLADQQFANEIRGRRQAAVGTGVGTGLLVSGVGAYVSWVDLSTHVKNMTPHELDRYVARLRAQLVGRRELPKKLAATQLKLVNHIRYRGSNGVYLSPYERNVVEQMLATLQPFSRPLDPLDRIRVRVGEPTCLLAVEEAQKITPSMKPMTFKSRLADFCKTRAKSGTNFSPLYGAIVGALAYKVFDQILRKEWVYVPPEHNLWMFSGNSVQKTSFDLIANEVNSRCLASPTVCLIERTVARERLEEVLKNHHRSGSPPLTLETPVVSSSIPP